MPDLQQHTAVSARGIELFRSIGRRLARSEKKSYSDDSSCGSGQDSRASADNSQQENVQRRLSGDECVENKTKKVSLQVENDDSSEKTSSSTSSGDLVTALGKVFRSLKIGGKKKKKKQQKSILRRPVPHVYVRGVSGLPQRVPLKRDYYRSIGGYQTTHLYRLH